MPSRDTPRNKRMGDSRSWILARGFDSMYMPKRMTGDDNSGDDSSDVRKLRVLNRVFKQSHPQRAAPPTVNCPCPAPRAAPRPCARRAWAGGGVSRAE